MSGDVKFIRVGGRVIPIKGKGSAPSGISKRYGAKREKPKPKQVGVAKGAAVGAAAGAAFRFAQQSGHVLRKMGTSAGNSAAFKWSVKQSLRNKSGILKTAAFASAIGAALGSVKVWKKGKGENDKQLLKRMQKTKGF